MATRPIYRASEDTEQQLVVQYCYIRNIPIVHIPNEGKRSVSYGAKLKRMGMKKGFPDLFIPKARNGFHGLFIELKATGGKVSSDQSKWITLLSSEGYAATVCVGFEAAITTINQYMEERWESK